MRNSAASRVLVAIVVSSIFRCSFAAGGGGDNVFTLKQYRLDNWEFWACFGGMVFYGFIIDRVQYFVTKKAAHNRCSKMIVERCITEFMVFGVVAMTLFAMLNLMELSSDLSTMLTFCDLLVSFGACFLILVGGIYAWFRHMVNKHLEAHATTDGSSAVEVMGWAPLNITMQKQFVERQGIDPAKFSWNLYFQESLANQICNLINVDWSVWLVTSMVCVPMIVFKYLHGGSEFTWYIAGFAIAAWVWVAMILCAYLHTRGRRLEMYALLDAAAAQTNKDISDSSSDAESWSPSTFEDFVQKVKPEIALLQKMAQLQGLLQSFMVGIYVMHIIYNLSYKGLGSEIKWHAIYIAPFALTILVLGPICMLEGTTVQAFVRPDPEVLDSIIHQVGEASMDLEFVRRQLESKAHDAGYTDDSGTNSPKSWAYRKLVDVNGDDTIMRSAMQSDFQAIGVYISEKRAKNIFEIVKSDVNNVKATSIDVKNTMVDLFLDDQVAVDVLVDMIFTSHWDQCQSRRGSTRQ